MATYLFPVTGLLNVFSFGGSGDLAEHHTFYPEKAASTVNDTAVCSWYICPSPLSPHLIKRRQKNQFQGACDTAWSWRQVSHQLKQAMSSPC